MPLNPPKLFLPIGLVLIAAQSMGCATETVSAESQAWTPAAANAVVHETVLATPPGTGLLKTAGREITGAPVGIACITCHGEGVDGAASMTSAAQAISKGKAEVHIGFELVHGDLQCVNCHNADDPGQLHSSAGESFALTESMRLCSQCHGLIKRSYDHGAHGGMRGYWDLQRGPRERNDCIACHNPHKPAHAQVIPVAGPKDKGVSKQQHAGSVIDLRFGKDEHE